LPRHPEPAAAIHSPFYGAYDDYVADITIAQEAWDPRPTQD